MRVVAMLHLPALPGAPTHHMAMAAIRDWILRDAEALAAGGVDALILENYGDAPFYPRRVPPETVAAMAVLAREVRARFELVLTCSATTGSLPWRWPVPLGASSSASTSIPARG
jgi:uncharacterized protein